jgi:hypothetical protein
VNGAWLIDVQIAGMIIACLALSGDSFAKLHQSINVTGSQGEKAKTSVIELLMSINLATLTLAMPGILVSHPSSNVHHGLLAACHGLEV